MARPPLELAVTDFTQAMGLLVRRVRAAAASQVSVALPSLASGTYRVQWSALTADDGPAGGGLFIRGSAAITSG